MAKYGFLIDQRKCIGCHACTVACKQEHDVPLGSFRTWVKYVESGSFPNTQRHFSVMRCNHCERPPCVDICPVTALYKRPDGIVDFDPEVCIGCKSCMQACPYDALFIEPSSGAAHKCNFCAHRIEVKREPPCVTVCPEQAIVMGDMEDPDSLIARLIGTEKTTVRAPEKATRPQLRYIDADPANLVPLAAPPSQSYVWSQAPSAPMPLPYTEEERAALARRTYDISHDRPWGWHVSAYLWTKSIASGAFLVPVLMWMLGARPSPEVLMNGAMVALAFLMATSVLLVADLKRPHKFLSILLRPQWKSWLVMGSYVLIGYGGVLAAYVALGLLGGRGVQVAGAEPVLLSLSLPLAILTACYTAFLFQQCEARDLWHSRALPWHLVAQALTAGVAVVVLGGVEGMRTPLLMLLVLDLILFFPLEIGGGGHHTPAAEKAAAIVRHGALSRLFWGAVVLLGHVAPAVLLFLPGGAQAAAVLALVGLLAYEHVFVVAGQAVPIS